jgi:uncharacterized radical SAM superfamily Fe-S cluster-containing enzyme
MDILGVTHSVCETCRDLVPAKVVTDGRDVYVRRFCPAHGESTAFVRAGVDDYRKAHRILKPAWRPRDFAGNRAAPCPDGCGFCDRHEQHLCMPIVEITERCDLACPVCLVDAGGTRDLAPEAFDRVLDALLRAEPQVDILNLSGGEPLRHPRLLDLVDRALARPGIVRVSLSTNGLRLLEEPALLRELAARRVVVSLQFDGLDDRVYAALRGRPLRAEKMALLDRLEEARVVTSLTMTAAAGVNEDQFRPVLDVFFSRRHVVSLMVQPVAYAGRAARWTGDGPRGRRLTLPDVVRLLGEAGHPAVRSADFVPLPCSHPLCFSLAFYLMLDGGGSVSVNGLVAAGEVMDLLANRTVFGLDPDEYRRLQKLVYALWSGPAGCAPDGEAVLNTLRGILRRFSCTCFDPRKAFALAEQQVKSIFVHAFQDDATFDLARVRHCCNAYPQPDGRLIPACVHNVRGRGRAGARPADPPHNQGMPSHA